MNDNFFVLDKLNLFSKQYKYLINNFKVIVRTLKID